MTLQTSPTSAPPSRAEIVKAAAASVTAWAFDLYDLFIILFVASTIGPLLFPSGNETLSLALVYLSFAVTLLMRPVGSAIFGPYADRAGRKRAMVIGICGVGIATALMGAVPTYATAGYLGPILFVALRLVQGVFVGGVVASTHTLGTESVPERWRGLVSGLVGGGGAGVGGVLASLVFLAASAAFPGDAFDSWGWRVMFFTGLVGAALSFVVFRSVAESPLWERQAARRAERAPVRSVFSPRYRKVFLLNLLVVVGAASAYYMTSGFLPTFYDKNLDLAPTTAATVLIFTSLSALISTPLVGHLSQRIGRRRTFALVGVPNLVALPLLYLALGGLDKNQIVGIAAFSVLLCLLANAAMAPVLVFLNERFPTRIRATGTSLSWNVGFALGGMTPTLVTALSGGVSNFPSTLAILLVIAGIIFLVGAVAVPETRGRFEDVEEPEERARRERERRRVQRAPARPVTQ